MLAAHCSAIFPLKASIPVAVSSLTYFPGSQRKRHHNHLCLTHDGHVILDLEECLLAALPQDVEGIGVGHAVQRDPIDTQQPVPNFQGPFPAGSHRQKVLKIFVFVYICIYLYSDVFSIYVYTSL